MGWYSDFWRRIYGPREIDGTNNADTLEDTRRDDTITALNGDDTIYVTYGDDSISGGRGEDTLYIEGNFDEYTLERLPMISDGRFEDDIWYLRSEEFGDKELSSIELVIDQTGLRVQTAPYDTLTYHGTEGEDFFFDGPFDDHIHMHGGDDYISMSGIGDDNVYGGDGYDTIILNVGEFSDFRVSGQGRLVMHNEELGNKIIFNVEDIFDSAGNHYDISSTSEANFVSGNFRDDTLSDTAGMDFITGYDGNDTIYTTTGDDTVIGGYGDDTLFVAGNLEDYEIIPGQEGNLELQLVSEEYGTKLIYDTENIGSIDGDAILSVEDMFA